MPNTPINILPTETSHEEQAVTVPLELTRNNSIELKQMLSPIEDEMLALNEEAFTTIENERSGVIQRFIQNSRRLPMFIRTQWYMILVSAVIAVPLLVDYLCYHDKAANQNKEFLQWTSRAEIGKMTIFHICVYILVCWGAFCQLNMILHYLPNAISVTADKIVGGSASESFREKMHHISASHSLIAFAGTLMIANRWLFPIFIDGSVKRVPMLYSMNLESRQQLKSGLCPEGYTLNTSKEMCDLSRSQMEWKSHLAGIQQLLLWTVLIFMVKRIIIQITAMRFHKTAYKNRISLGRFHSWVLEHLNKARIDFLKKGHTKAPIQITTERSSDYRDSMSSPIPAKLSLSEITKHAFASFENPDSVTFYNTKHAKKFSAELFQALANNRNVTQDDFRPYFETEVDAKRAYMVFDKDLMRDISFEEMQATVLGMHKDRENLAKALLDGGDAIGSLDSLLAVVVWTVLVVLWAVNLSSVTVKDIWTPFSAVFFGLSFVFGGVLKDVFNSIIFMFSMHPYDIGDRVTVDNGAPMTVVHMSLLDTVFRRSSDNESVNIPNHVLSSKQLTNLRRSDDQLEKLTFIVPASTSEHKLVSVREALESHIEHHRRYFYKRVDMVVAVSDDMKQLNLTIVVRHKGSFQDQKAHAIRSNNWAIALRSAFLKAGLMKSEE